MSGNCGQKKLSTGRIQLRKTAGSAVRIELRGQIIDQYHRRPSKYRCKVPRLGHRDGGDEQLDFTTRQGALKGMASNGEPQIGPMGSHLCVTPLPIASQ